MPFALILAGIALILVGYQGTQTQFFALLEGDIPKFTVWGVAIFIIGAIGYIPKAKDLSNAFLVLVILGLFISNRGFFKNFNQAIGIGATGTNG